MSFNNKTNIDILSNKLNNILDETVDSTNPKTFANGVVAGVTNNKKTIYLEARGVKNISTGQPIEKEAIFNFYSCTKAITTTAILQLWENGLLDLDAPVKKYLPKLGKIGIIKGFNDDNKPILENPKADITMRMLLTHTAGFSYNFFNEEYCKSLELYGQPNFRNINETTMDHTYLTSEPGTKWHYGMNLDWAGFVLEEITGKKLGDYIKENIFKPANMNSCAFNVKDSNVVTLHLRTAEGLIVSPYQPDQDPVLNMGGHGLFGTVDDYLKFIRIWLNEGKTAEGVQIISQETYNHAIKNNLPDGLHVTDLTSFDRTIANLIVMDPHIKPDTWSLGFAIAENALPGGRPKGSLHWSGVANLYYIIDIKNKIGVYWATQIFPFGDASSNGFVRMENAVYESLN